MTSFTAGVLTITLNDGATTVVGKVDASTRLRCVPAVASTIARVADHGGTNRSDRGNGRGNDGQGATHNDASQTEPGEDHHTPPPAGTSPAGAGAPPAGNDGQNYPGEDDDHPGPGGAARCDSSSLVAGTVLHEAQLKLDANGVVFKQIVLVKG